MGRNRKRRNDRNLNQSLAYQRIFDFYYAWLKNIAISMYKWSLPKSMDERFLELALFENGKCLIYEKDGVLINTRATPSNEMTMYNFFKGYNAYNVVFSDYVKDVDCVYGLNNPLSIPTEEAVYMYATRLQKLEMGIWSNVDLQKFPLMISCTEEQKLSAVNTMEQFEGGVPYIFTYKTFDENTNIHCLNNQVPMVFKDLYDLKKQTLQEFFEYLGVRKTKEKKERLLSSEIISDNATVGASGNTFLSERKKICERVNDRFAYLLKEPLSVEVRDYAEILQMTGGIDI